MMTQTIRVIIERSNDKYYSAYMPDDDGLPFCATGEGTTPQDARSDFLNVIDAFRQDFPELIPDLSFVFCYDVPSFLEYYNGRLSLAGLSRITGVAQGQLSHYITGRRRPSPETVKKINQALHNFADELSQIRLV